MKQYNDRVALELEGVEADKSADFASRKLYVMQDEPGRLYRRLYRPKKGEFGPEGAVEAVCNGSLCLFLAVQELDAELAKAGFTSTNHRIISELSAALTEKVMPHRSRQPMTNGKPHVAVNNFGGHAVGDDNDDLLGDVDGPTDEPPVVIPSGDEEDGSNF